MVNLVGEKKGLDQIVEEVFGGRTATHSPSDPVNHPSHYTQGEVECYEAIKACSTPEAYQGWLRGNIMKYLWRYKHKGNSTQNLNKAQWFLNKLKETLDDPV